MRILGDWIKTYLEFTENTEPPLSFRLWTAVATLAAALERRVWVEWEGPLYVNHFIVLVAKAGRARKGTAMRPAESMLRELGVNLAAESMTREALIKRLAGLSGLSDIKLDVPSITSDSALTIFSEEWTVFIGYQNAILMADLCNLYDCKTEWRYETKTAGTFDIPNVWLHMFAGTTPELLLSTLPPDSVGGGLTSRTIFVFEEDKGKVVILPVKTDREKELREKLLHDLREIKQLSGPFSYSDGFMDIYVPWRIAHEKNPPFRDTPLEAYSQRRTSHLLKLSMVMCISRSSEMVLRADDIQRAIGVLVKTERKMPLAFRGIGKASNAQVLNSLMMTIQTRKTITIRELTKLYWQDIGADEHLMNAMIKTLHTMKFVTVKSDAEDTYVTYVDEPGSDNGAIIHSGELR